MLALVDVAIPVSNAPASARWWEEKVGFASFTMGPPGSHVVLVAPPGERYLLHLCEGFAPLEPGNTGIGFVTDDLAGEVARLTAQGVRFVEPLTNPGEPGAIAKFVDPDGNIFWLLGMPAAFVRRERKRRAPLAPARRPARRAPRGRASRRR